MKALRDEFAAITQIADAGSAAGDPALVSALQSFATDWSDKRTQLINQLNDLAAKSDQAVREYSDTDNTLARVVRIHSGGGA
jgi:hypothetical protein